MPREIEISAAEKDFIVDALAEGLRLDGRGPEQYRDLSLTFGEGYGVADLSLGKTRVFAKVSAEVTVPYPDRASEGIFAISLELSPMASPTIEPHRSATETEVALSRLLEKTIRRSGALDTEALCLRAGEKVWTVRVDLHVLSNDGNLADAACLAAVAALRHFRRPDTSVDGETLTVHTSAEREPVPLGWLHSPLCVTFSFFRAGGEGRPPQLSVLDATWREEQVRAGSVTVGLNRHGEVCQIYKPGGEGVDALELLRCTGVALARVKEMSDFLDEKLAEDAGRRDQGGSMARLLAAENDR